MTRGDRMRADDNGEGERDRASATAVRCVVHVVVALGAQGAVVSTEELPASHRRSAQSRDDG